MILNISIMHKERDVELKYIQKYTTHTAQQKYTLCGASQINGVTKNKFILRLYDNLRN